MKLKQYLKYKESGVQWIDKIPESWTVKRGKFNYEIIGKTNIPASEGEDDGKYPFFTSGKNIKFIDKSIIKGEFIIVGDGGIPNFEYYNGVFSYSDHCFLLRINKNNYTKFLYYYLLGKLDVLDALCFQGMGLRNLEKYSFNSFVSCWPPKEEQFIIASFLDKKISEINNLLKKDKKLIELLKEKRIVLINHIVTKGLNQKVKLKDSEIKWIGKIPEGWEVKKLKYFADEIKEKNVSDEKDIYLGLENIESFTCKILNYEDSNNIEGESIRFNENDILFGKLRPYLSKVTIMNKTGCCSSELIVYKSKRITYPKFLMYKLISKSYIDYVNSLTYGVKMPRADPVFLLNIKHALPSKLEQIKIAEYLDKATSKIDQTIQKIEKKIELLEEYKKSLIHHVVTGKVDVGEEK